MSAKRVYPGDSDDLDSDKDLMKTSKKPKQGPTKKAQKLTIRITNPSIANIDIHPDGDLIIVLSKLKEMRPFISRVIKGLKPKISKGSTQSNGVPDELHVRVHTSQLKLVSKAFTVFLRPDSAVEKAASGALMFRFDEDHGAAMLILLLIVFGQSRLVPQSMTLAGLHAICTLIDKYMLQEVAAPMAKVWASNLPKPVFQTTDVQTIAIAKLVEIKYGLSVGRTFGQKELFADAVKAHLWANKSSLDMADTPFPDKLLTKLNTTRIGIMESLAGELLRLVARYLNNTKWCKSAHCSVSRCDATALGMLYRGISDASETDTSDHALILSQDRFWKQGSSLRACLQNLDGLNWASCNGQMVTEAKKRIRASTERKASETVKATMREFWK